MAKTKDETIRSVTTEYLDALDLANLPTLDDLKGDLIDATQKAFQLENSVKDKGMAWRMPDTLTPWQIAALILKIHHVHYISCTESRSSSDYDVLGVYQETGPDAGLYVTDLNVLSNLIAEYDILADSRKIEEVIKILQRTADRCPRCTDQDLIPVNNGIFDYRTKTLRPFSPDYVFLSKSRVDYNPNAFNQTIYNPDDKTSWDVESWMQELSDDPEIVELLWEIMGAIIRPFVHWNKAAWFYSEIGNNGKGTLCELMRGLCGDGSYASIPLSLFSQEFMLEPLVRASAIIVDENDVGGYVDKAANLKAVITQDVIQINRKFKSPMALRFRGFMVQCLNEFPRIKDKSDSFYRRQLFVPFEKNFTGRERKYIKADYLHRREVLEYVMHKVLHMDYYSLSEPAACKAALAEYKDYNDPVRQFAEDIIPQCQWDALPYKFLYDLYKSWYSKNCPGGSIEGSNKFTAQIRSLIRNGSLPDYAVLMNASHREMHFRASRIAYPEPLILTYGLKDWQDPHYTGGDKSRICTPNFDRDKNFTGIYRIGGTAIQTDGAGEPDKSET